MACVGAQPCGEKAEFVITCFVEKETESFRIFNGGDSVSFLIRCDRCRIDSNRFVITREMLRRTFSDS